VSDVWPEKIDQWKSEAKPSVFLRVLNGSKYRNPASSVSPVLFSCSSAAIREALPLPRGYNRIYPK